KIVKKGGMTYADGRFYFVQERDGKVFLISADPTGAKLQGSFTLNPQTKKRKPKGRIWTHPVISDGKLYLRDQEIVYCFDIKAR
ncbi:MAG: polyvinylalcohol dehydrogenase, partial [Planctomycetota bacterium]